MNNIKYKHNEINENLITSTDSQYRSDLGLFLELAPRFHKLKDRVEEHLKERYDYQIGFCNNMSAYCCNLDDVFLYGISRDITIDTIHENLHNSVLRNNDLNKNK